MAKYTVSNELQLHKEKLPFTDITDTPV